MIPTKSDELSRRTALGALIGGAAGCSAEGPRGAEGETSTRAPSKKRMPVVFLPHGGGPWPFVELGFGDPRENEALASYLRSLPGVTPVRPSALLVISAHWEEAAATVMSSASPPMLYDYYGFPPESYQITWPAPGDPKLAARIRELLSAGGFDSAEHAERGFDHGTFVPLKLAYPNAEIPTVQLSLVKGLDPKVHLALGRALRPLRDEGVFIIGSGMSYHNMRGFMGRGGPDSELFDGWLKTAVTADLETRDRHLTEWATAPAARSVHPREEHLLPLMVIAGAAGDDLGTIAYNDTYAGVRLSAVHFG